MKQFPLLFGLLLVLGSVLVFADTPPALVNHQFYGNVYWDSNISVAPTLVNARIAGQSYSSVISDLACNGRVCSATYGKAADNILRVQGSNGLQITFFLGDTQVTQVPYVDNKVQELDLNIATQPVVCNSNFNCSEWSACVLEKQNRTCEDLNYCGVSTSWNRTEEQGCSVGRDSSRGVNRGSPRNPPTSVAAGAGGACTQSWSCSLYSLCVGSEQRRSCSRSDSCGDGAGVIVVPKPDESKVCVSRGSSQSSSGSTGTAIPSTTSAAETCFDSILNQDERGIDCGGACKPCPEKKAALAPSPASSNSLLMFGVAALAILVIGLIIFLVIHKKKVAVMSGGSGGSSTLSYAIISQLDSAYSRGEASGMSRSDVTQKLVDKGWDMETLEEYLMKK